MSNNWRNQRSCGTDAATLCKGILRWENTLWHREIYLLLVLRALHLPLAIPTGYGAGTVTKNTAACLRWDFHCLLPPQWRCDGTTLPPGGLWCIECSGDLRCFATAFWFGFSDTLNIVCRSTVTIVRADFSDVCFYYPALMLQILLPVWCNSLILAALVCCSMQNTCADTNYWQLRRYRSDWCCSHVGLWILCICLNGSASQHGSSFHCCSLFPVTAS